jgi:hypothetical protein
MSADDIHAKGTGPFRSGPESSSQPTVEVEADSDSDSVAASCFAEASAVLAFAVDADVARERPSVANRAAERRRVIR